MKRHSNRIHFVGIGGIGMSGIAKILIRSGFSVSGSDVKENQETDSLQEMGATVFVGHRSDNAKDADVIVYSSAVSEENPELVVAKQRRIPILSRGEMLAELMRMKHSIVVAGAHGKTTTSAIITTLLMEGGYDPTAVIGGRLRSIATNAKMGSDAWFVCESDESDGSFLKLLPTVAVITNIDREHLNHYGTFDALKSAFVDFANRVPFDGAIILCRDNAPLSDLESRLRRPMITYGIQSDAMIRAKGIRAESEWTRFEIEEEGASSISVRIPLWGEHNVLNALAAYAVGRYLGMKSEVIAKGLERFSGIERRLELKGETKGVRVFDDYAHHPTEIRATLSALHAHKGTGRVRLLFQPHRYTRVRDLWDEFLSAFDQADHVVLLPIYAASERKLSGIENDTLASAIAKRGQTNVTAVHSMEEGVKTLTQQAASGDFLVAMGAGDINRASRMLLEELEGGKR